MRETLRALEHQRLIHNVPRRGAFVSDLNDSQWRLQVTQGFLEAGAHSPARSIKTDVFRASHEPLPLFAATALELNRGETGFVIERVRYVDGGPALHSTNYLLPEVGEQSVGRASWQGQAALNQTLEKGRLSDLFGAP